MESYGQLLRTNSSSRILLANGMAQLTIQQAFDQAVQYHQSGQLQEAERLYRQILAQEPGHANAMHNLGLAAYQAGRNDLAVDLIRRAIVLKPDFAEAHCNLGNALRGQGQLEEAVAAYHQAVAFRPDFAEAHYNLGIVLKELGRLDDAIITFRRAIALNPDSPAAHVNLGNALRDRGQLDAAVAAFRQAIVLKPNYVEAHHNLGNVLRARGDLDEAIAAHRQVVALTPNYAEGHSNLGVSLANHGRLDEAIASFRQAIVLRPNYAEAHYNLGIALADQGRLDESIAAYRQAIALRPDSAEAHHNLAWPLLLRGEFAAGWEEFEWRFRVRSFGYNRGFYQPQWDGSDLTGKTILLHAEAGHGDTVQFVRYAPLVAHRGGHVILECQPALVSLLAQVPGIERVIPYGDPLPHFDCQIHLLSLPRIFHTTLDNIPRSVPYLAAPAERARLWKERLREDRGLKVGLVWAGSDKVRDPRKRTASLSVLAPLASVAGVQFYSLQKGEAAHQAAHPPQGMPIIDWTEELHDFADTASLMDHLDLIISVDTGVVHVAGAMGKPVWVLLPFIADWRWLLAREDSPWYPTLRLFRQSKRGEPWEDVAARMSKALEDEFTSLRRGASGIP